MTTFTTQDRESAERNNPDIQEALRIAGWLESSKTMMGYEGSRYIRKLATLLVEERSKHD